MRTVTLLLLVCLLPVLAQATHNRAGEITYRQTADNTIEATIVTYTQESSFPADRDSLMLCWGDGTCTTVLRTNGSGESLPNDYKVNYYTGTHVYQQAGAYQLSITDFNRNDGILNVNSPNSALVEFHLQSMVTLMDFSVPNSNQSPKLLEAPIDVGFVHQPFMHTPNAVDLDGDSIAYEIVTPLRGNDVPVPNYLDLDEISPGTENSYIFDEKTGLLEWRNPQIVGQYNIAIKIKAYRNGELVDMMVRDMQILIQSEENLPPIIEIEDMEVTNIQVKVGETVNFKLTATDPEDGALDGYPEVTFTGSTFDFGAVAVATSSFGAARGDFTWEVPSDAAQAIPYRIAIKAVDSKGFATFKIIEIQVSEASVSFYTPLKELGARLFPNPSTANTFLELPDTQLGQEVTITIFDNMGRVANEQRIDNAPKEITLPTASLPKGTYFVTLQTKDIRSSSYLFIQ
ncbi:MAG: T9SS type A sorting domain-containing protein [Bacteroidota bacterium]